MSYRSRTASLALGGYAISALTMGAGLIVLGCSANTRARLMHFFFEYPEDRPAESETQTAVEPRELLEQRPTPAISPGSRHAPFVLRQCDACHRQAESQSPLKDLMPACKRCHQPFFAEHKFSHAPVTQDCRTCHQMHTSRYESLLITRPPDLCLDCHDPDDEEMEGDHHVDLETVSCTRCHDPHFGERKGLLKPNWKSATSKRQSRNGRWQLEKLLAAAHPPNRERVR